MATLNIGYTFVNATPAVASQVNANFQDVKTFVEGISAGTNIDAGAIELTKLSNAAIQQLTPSGSIMQYAGTAAPTGWILCDGSAVSTTTYAALFAVIGTAFNTSGGQSAPSAGTFRVPLLTGRVPVGRDASNTAFDVLGETGGSATSTALHTHSDGTLATVSAAANITLNGGSHSHTGSTNGGEGSHDHTVNTSGSPNTNAHQHSISDRLALGPSTQSAATLGSTFEVNADFSAHTHGFTTAAAGTGHTLSDANHWHDVEGFTGGSTTGANNGNLQPYIVVNYIIKA
jgi:microcystin-dependent protein